jgi:hypothetical protein
MSTGQATIARRTGVMSGLLRHRWARIGLQVLLVVGFSAMTAAAKKLHPSVGIPGSSAIYWLTAMVVARCTMKWDGAATLVGAGTAVWGIPVGLEQGFGQNLLSFAVAGLLLDVMFRVFRTNARTWWGAPLCALVASMGQFGVIIYSALSSSVTKHFMVVGLMQSTLLHIGFGLAAGLLGWAAFRGVQLVPLWRKS